MALLVLGLFGASMSVTAQGNSEAAQGCKKGGWASLARTDDPTTSFADQGECVRYGAQGGAIVDLVTINPAITEFLRPSAPVDPECCFVDYGLTGFALKTSYVVKPVAREAGTVYDHHLTFEVMTDDVGNARGDWGGYVESENATAGDAFIKFSMESLGVDSGFIEVHCTE